MAWQPEVGAGVSRATDYRDFVTKQVQQMCSQHVATVAVNNGGTATYVVGDILTLTHASAHLDARFEVTTVSAGVITGLRINSSGAFAQQAVSATVSVAGTGYQVGDILQVQGGSSRLPAKFKVATLSGSGVATVTLFEGGGVYATTPANAAATVGVGSSGSPAQTYAGDDACTLTVTYQAIIGTTALAVTGGSGGGSPTVDITLAESGWEAVTDHNDYTENSLTDEKEVVLKGGASGFTNKPYFGIRTGTDTISTNTRYAVQYVGFVAYNPSLNFTDQVQHSPGPSASDTFADSGSYLIFPQNLDNEVDFWMSVDDQRITGAINTNPAANTDDGRYESYYVGYGDRAKTETEDPYPMVCFASSRQFAADPTVSQGVITTAAEARNTGSSGPVWVYFTEDSVWRDMLNNTGGTPVPIPEATWPFGDLPEQATGGSVENIVTKGTVPFDDNVFKRDRSAPTRILRPVPGTVDLIFRWPVIFARRVGTTVSQTTDNVRVALRGYFAIFNDDGSGSRIVNFSEDYLSEGTAPTADVRYKVFQNWDLTERYQYIAIHEDV